MTTQELTFSIAIYDSIDELGKDYAFLLSEARRVTKYAYAPYSNFHVGAFARLINGETIQGTNQENASFPAGICAERTLLSAVCALHSGVGISTMAISYNNFKGTSNEPVSPCGICRQSLVEFQARTKTPIRIILSGMQGKVIIINNANDLLPLTFGSDSLK